MEHRRLFRGARPPALCVAVAAWGLPLCFSAPPARAELPVRALLTRRADAPPEGAGALRFSVRGDSSGARVQARLLALGTGRDVGAYFAAPPVKIDFTGWKTVTVPLEEFTFQSEQSPEAIAPALPSVDHVQFAVTAASAKLFLDDLVWAAPGASPTDAPLRVIDAFEDAPTAWNAGGSYDQLRAVTWSLNKVVPLVGGGAGSLRVEVLSRAQSEKRLHAPALLARLKRAPVPYVVYARPPFETIVPASTPAPAEVQKELKLSLFACADEIEPTTFAVYAGRDLKDVGVTVASEFLSESKKVRLPRTAIDVRVVKVWEQAGLGPLAEPGDVVSVPELLVKDDRTPLVGPAPAVRLDGDPQTDIPGGTSKQFWVTVRVPRAQLVSTYTGRLLVSAKGMKPTPITVSVQVLPMRLRTAFLQYGIDFRTRLAGEEAAPGEPVVTPEVFARQLANIRDHGFKFVSLYDRMPVLADALRLYREAGLSRTGPVVVMSPVKNRGDIEAIENLRLGAGLGADFDIYYGTPVAPVGDRVDPAREGFALVRETSRRALAVAPIVSQTSFDALGQALDVPVYNVSSEYAQRLLETGMRQNNKRDWWSWNIAQENPVMNRLYTGYLLYRTGVGSTPLYGAFPGPYQYAPGSDPFGETAPAPLDGKRVSRPQMTTYPAQDGVIDTLQWEAAREGVDDIRYITNLKTYLRDVKDLKIRKDATDQAEAFLQKALARPLATLPAGELQTIRRGIVDQALKLLTILRGSPTVPRYPD